MTFIARGFKPGVFKNDGLVPVIERCAKSLIVGSAVQYDALRDSVFRSNLILC